MLLVEIALAFIIYFEYQNIRHYLASMKVPLYYFLLHLFIPLVSFLDLLQMVFVKKGNFY